MQKIVITFFVLLFAVQVYATEIGGVNFEDSEVVEGKTLNLNGVTIKKALVFVKVYAGAFYAEKKITSAKEAIESERIKQIKLHYLTNKATAEKIQNGFLELMEKANSKEMLEKQKINLEKHLSWLTDDMEIGYVSTTTYVPGKGLTFALNGVEKGTIEDKEYIKMYFTYCFGEKAEKNIREGYLSK